MTLQNDTILSIEDLQRAAFALLSSSSISRYVRMAKELAISSGLSDLVRSGIVDTDRLINRVEVLWRAVTSSPERDVAEFELAVILAELSKMADTEVDRLFNQIGLYDKGSAAWISGLARYLNMHRAENTSWPSQHPDTLDVKNSPMASQSTLT